MFSCKVCLEKDRHIKTLEAHISSLTEMVLPKNSGGIPLSNMEADAILSGNQDLIVVDDNPALTEEELAERDRILSGNY